MTASVVSPSCDLLPHAGCPEHDPDTNGFRTPARSCESSTSSRSQTYSTSPSHSASPSHSRSPSLSRSPSRSSRSGPQSSSRSSNGSRVSSNATSPRPSRGSVHQPCANASVSAHTVPENKCFQLKGAQRTEAVPPREAALRMSLAPLADTGSQSLSEALDEVKIEVEYHRQVYQVDAYALCARKLMLEMGKRLSAAGVPHVILLNPGPRKGWCPRGDLSGHYSDPRNPTRHVRYPRLGALEVTLHFQEGPAILVWSKLQSRQWPKVAELASRVVQVSTRSRGCDELGSREHGANCGDTSHHPQQETKWDALRRWSKAVLTKDRLGHTGQKWSEQNDQSRHFIQRKRGKCSENKVAPAPPGVQPESDYMPSRRCSAWCRNGVFPVLLDARGQRPATTPYTQMPAAAQNA